MSAPRPLAKGWCPGVLRPMASGDGFIARVRPRGAALSFEALAMLARAAGELGNGLADLTTQANIQLRGLDAAGVAELAIRLAFPARGCFCQVRAPAPSSAPLSFR